MSAAELAIERWPGSAKGRGARWGGGEMRAPTLVLLLVNAMLWAACTATLQPQTAAKPADAPSTSSPPAGLSSSPPIAPRAGSAAPAKDCVVITAANEPEGLASEGNWLHQHYPGWHKTSQSLVMGSGGKSYDLVSVVTPDAKTHEVCFDITSFYGKF